MPLVQITVVITVDPSEYATPSDGDYATDIADHIVDEMYGLAGVDLISIQHSEPQKRERH
tara:strand:+ start:764 stop:943 length:180 start_codon:yes stop_codon:yes gene_type:complete